MHINNAVINTHDNYMRAQMLKNSDKKKYLRLFHLQENAKRIQILRLIVSLF